VNLQQRYDERTEKLRNNLGKSLKVENQAPGLDVNLHDNISVSVSFKAENIVLEAFVSFPVRLSVSLSVSLSQ